MERSIYEADEDPAPEMPEMDMTLDEMAMMK